MHPVRGVSRSLAPIWHHLGLKMEQEAVPEAALTSLGSIFWRLGGGEKPSKSSYAAETAVFRRFGALRRAKMIFTEFWDPL